MQTAYIGEKGRAWGSSQTLPAGTLIENSVQLGWGLSIVGFADYWKCHRLKHMLVSGEVSWCLMCDGL